MGDRYNIHSQLEHLQSKYVGKKNKNNYNQCFIDFV